MPELPEVETYVRELEPELKGRSVTSAVVLWPKIIAEPSVETFQQAIVGQRFVSFGRRGKFMLLGLEGGDSLIVHLRMTGKLLIQPLDALADKHTHVVLELDDGRQLHYNDARKFGRLWLVHDTDPVLQKLGPEPLGDDFTAEWFATCLAGRKASIKALLLNQSIVAGVGNIYADEALFAAAIHPARAGGLLELDEIERLLENVKTVLEGGIERRGSSLGDSGAQNYVRPGGESGGYQDEHKVFRKTGQPCPVCTTTIERIVLAQRSTHFCPNCQA
jgi:formamidopyrimidine-DNA glycosylase